MYDQTGDIVKHAVGLYRKFNEIERIKCPVLKRFTNVYLDFGMQTKVLHDSRILITIEFNHIQKEEISKKLQTFNTHDRTQSNPVS